MKKRHSLYKAEWSKTREDKYRKDCDHIPFLKEKELLFDENKVNLKSNEETSLLMYIEKSKSMRYEISLKLKQS